jgi:hypothetical protein
VGRQHAIDGHVRGPAVHRCQGPERFCVEDGSASVRLPRRGPVGRGSAPSSRGWAKPRTHHQGVVIVIEYAGQRRPLDPLPRRRPRAASQRRRLYNLGREERLERLRRGQRDEPGSGAAGGRANEQGRSGVVHRTGQDEQFSERALVATRRSLWQQCSDGDVVESRWRWVGAVRHRGPRPSLQPPQPLWPARAAVRSAS